MKNHDVISKSTRFEFLNQERFNRKEYQDMNQQEIIKHYDMKQVYARWAERALLLKNMRMQRC